jgi:hypothetical protein
MPKDECESVLGGAARKALGVRNAIKKDTDKALGRAPRKALGVKKTMKTGAGTAKPKKEPKAAVPALTVPVSILRSPRSTSTTPPSSPIARSPTYKQEEWRTSHATLAARIDVGRAELRALSDRVKQLEEELGFPKKGAAEDARTAEDARPAPSRFGE